MTEKENHEETLKKAREEFICQWGALGTQWGISRTMAQIHALLLVSPAPLSTDEVMEALQISRGNANSNLRALVDWKLLRMVLRKGERKDYYEAEKDVWMIFRAIARERRKREIEPALQVLQGCADRTRDLAGEEARVFHTQLEALAEFVSTANSLMEKVSEGEQAAILAKALKLLL